VCAADGETFALVAKGLQSVRGELLRLFGEMFGDENTEFSWSGSVELFGEVDKGVTDVPPFHSAFDALCGEAEGESHEGCVLAAEDGVGLEVVGWVGEEEFFKLIISKRINRAFSCVTSGADVWDKVVDVFDDGFAQRKQVVRESSWAVKWRLMLSRDFESAPVKA